LIKILATLLRQALNMKCSLKTIILKEKRCLNILVLIEIQTYLALNLTITAAFNMLNLIAMLAF
jgi:hypothetical protein